MFYVHVHQIKSECFLSTKNFFVFFNLLHYKHCCGTHGKKTVVEIYLCITLESSGNIIFFFQKNIRQTIPFNWVKKNYTRTQLFDWWWNWKHALFKYLRVRWWYTRKSKDKKKIQTSFVATNKQKVKLSATNTRNRFFSYFFFFCSKQTLFSCRTPICVASLFLWLL